MGLVLTASGAVAAERTYCSPEPMRMPGPLPARQVGRDSGRIVDHATGTSLQAIRLHGGAVQIEASASGLDMVKTLLPNGDFTVRIRVGDDVLVMVRTSERLRVTRRGQTGVVNMTRPDQAGLDAVQMVLAGSTAARQFRAVRTTLTPDTLATDVGAGVDIVDGLLGVLQGEPSLNRRRHVEELRRAEPGEPPDLFERAAGPMLTAVGPRTCYEDWEREAVRAFDDYEGCVKSFEWWNPYREVCAFAWVIRAESAWFRLIGCSSIPLKED